MHEAYQLSELSELPELSGLSRLTGFMKQKELTKQTLASAALVPQKQPLLEKFRSAEQHNLLCPAGTVNIFFCPSPLFFFSSGGADRRRR